MEHTKGEWKMRGILPIGFHVYSKNTNNPIAVGIENEIDAHLIVSAVNACAKVNPDNPQAVAESISDLYEALVALYLWVLNLPDEAMMHVLKPAPMNKSEQAIAKAEGG